ncbi:unnamed protein product, partial [marine sediment metagenome]
EAPGVDERLAALDVDDDYGAGAGEVIPEESPGTAPDVLQEAPDIPQETPE